MDCFSSFTGHHLPKNGTPRSFLHAIYLTQQAKHYFPTHVAVSFSLLPHTIKNGRAYPHNFTAVDRRAILVDNR